MRIDKFLSHTGFGSRKEVKSLLRKKLVEVDGEVINDGKFNFNEETAEVTVAGEVIHYEKEVYYLLNKPNGVISATEDRVHQTVVNLLRDEDYRADIFPVGRLDKDTTGFLILTSDGKFSHNVLSPKKHVPKTYQATIQGIVTLDDQRVFLEGAIISGNEKCKPAELVILETADELNQSKIEVTISDGKYHQVKRMFESVGKQVMTLHRKSMGDIVLDKDLSAGDYRKLTIEEIDHLKNYHQRARD